MRTTPFDEMDRLFDQMRRSVLDGQIGGFGSTNLQLESDEDGFLVHADLPGFETEEIDLRFDDGALTLEAVHETDGEERTRSRRVREELRVPGDVLVEEIEADYRNGVLEVRLPTRTEPDDEPGYRIDLD